MSQLTGLVSIDYLDFKYTNSVDLTTDSYNKNDIDNVLLPYSTGSYVDYDLANKVFTTGDASISGNLEVQRFYITNTTARPFEINNTLHNGPYLLAISQNFSSNDLLFALRCRPLNQLWCFGVATSNQYIISHENSTKLSIKSNGNTTSGNLDVSVSNTRTSIKAYNTTDGYIFYVELEAKWNSQGYLKFESNRVGEVDIFLTIRDDLYMYCGDNRVHFYKTTTNASDDRLKENGELIANACET